MEDILKEADGLTRKASVECIQEVHDPHYSDVTSGVFTP